MTVHESDAFFEVSDLYLAAALLAAGEGVETISVRNGRAAFCFAKSGVLTDLLLRYGNRSLSIDARTMADAAGHLKSLLRSLPQGPVDQGRSR